MRRIFASDFRAGFVLSFRGKPSEFNYSDKGSRFFDRDYDPSKSLLHVLAQCLTRSSPARTSDQDCLSPSPMPLDVGKVDVTYCIHVPAVGVQSHVPSEDLSNCTGHAAAVSSQRPSVNDRTGCLFGFFDVVWATSGWIADSLVVSWEWYRSPPRTESHEDRRKLPDAKRPSRVISCQVPSDARRQQRGLGLKV